MDTLRKTGRAAGPLGLAVLALASSPAHAQWNYYGNGQSFYVPFTNPNQQAATEPRYVSLSLNYIVGFNGFNLNGQSYTPGIMLGLNQQNTSGFSFVQLTPQGGLPVGCSTPGMGCPLNWNSQTGSVTLGGTSAGNMPLLPDSGIGYMPV